MLVTGATDYRIDPINNLESGNYSDIAPRNTPRVLHTHLPHHMLPKSIMDKKIVYVMRDPRDQLVSLYHHHQGLKWSPTVPFKEFFENVLNNPHKGTSFCLL